MPYSPMELADAFIKTGELTDAIEALDQQLEQTPQDDMARRLRASVLLRLGSPEYLTKAMADLEAVADKNADDFVQLSIVYQQAEQIEQAINAMKSAHTLGEADERIIERLLNLYVQQQNYEQALELVRQQAREWRWLQWEADILVLAGEDAWAAGCYELVISQLEERFDLAAEGYLRAIQCRNLLACAHIYRRLRKYEAAEAYYVRARAISPDDVTIEFHRGVLLALLGDLEGALALCQPAIRSVSQFLHDELLRDLQTHPELGQLYMTLKGRERGE